MSEATELCAVLSVRESCIQETESDKVCCSQQIQKGNYKPFDIDMELWDL